MNSYTKLSKKSNPNQVLVDFVTRIKKTGKVLEIGAGPLIESQFLLEQGFSVDAYDKDPVSFEKSKSINSDNFTFHLESVEESNFTKNNYDLLVSFLTLPFILPSEFRFVVNKIFNAIKKDGYVILSLFGKRDDWFETHNKMTFLSREQVEDMFYKDFEIKRLIEEDKIGLTVDGKIKKWHIFTVVAKKL